VAQQQMGLQVGMFWVMGVQVCARQRLFVVYTWRWRCRWEIAWHSSRWGCRWECFGLWECRCVPVKGCLLYTRGAGGADGRWRGTAADRTAGKKCSPHMIFVFHMLNGLFCFSSGGLFSHVDWALLSLIWRVAVNRGRGGVARVAAHLAFG